MTLSDKEYKAFLRTHLDLLYFVGLEQKIITPKTTFDDFVNLDFKLKFKCRESLLANDNLLDDYLSLQFDYLTTEQVEILTGFKKK